MEGIGGGPPWRPARRPDVSLAENHFRAPPALARSPARTGAVPGRDGRPLGSAVDASVVPAQVGTAGRRAASVWPRLLDAHRRAAEERDRRQRARGLRPPVARRASRGPRDLQPHHARLPPAPARVNPPVALPARTTPSSKTAPRRKRAYRLAGGRRPVRTTNGSATVRPDAWHPVHRHDVAVCELAIGGSSSTVAVATRQNEQHRCHPPGSETAPSGQEQAPTLRSRMTLSRPSDHATRRPGPATRGCLS
jgi:hypothetical protein